MNERTYTIEEIQEAFNLASREDSWGIQCVYWNSLLARLVNTPKSPRHKAQS